MPLALSYEENRFDNTPGKRGRFLAGLAGRPSASRRWQLYEQSAPASVWIISQRSRVGAQTSQEPMAARGRCVHCQ